ncbi:MAG TPA: hypothetical protein ENN81_08645 [Phycisphaerales bacterium]|nr:hypothetical protein [Phycisphaerales bacterium]
MNAPNDNELRSLLEGFYNSEQVEAGLDDFENGRKLFVQNPAPAPSREALAGVKADVRRALARRHHSQTVRRIAFGASIAAAAVLAVAVRVGLLETAPLMPPGTMAAAMIPASFWEGHDVTVSDPSLAYFAAEIEQIENELASLHSGGKHRSGEAAVTELEVEFIDIQGDFWKG